MSSLKGIQSGKDACGASLSVTRVFSKIATISLALACGQVHAAGSTAPESYNGTRQNNADLRINKNSLNGNASIASSALFIARPGSSDKIKHEEINKRGFDQEEESSGPESRVWAMLLVSLVLVSLRIRGLVDRANRVL